MKKTKLLAALAVAATMSLGGALALTGCGEHEHSYTKWNYDNANHWLECPDDGAKDESTYGEHHFDGNTCTDCGYTLAEVQTGTLSGTVTAYGKALGGVKVAIGDNETVTSATGKYSLENVEIKDGVTVTFSKEDYETLTKTISSSNWTQKEATLNAEMTYKTVSGTVSGTVTYNSAPVSGATVIIGSSQIRTDENGDYTLENVALNIGDTAINVVHPAYETYSGTVTLAAGETSVEKDITLTAKSVTAINKTYIELAAMQAASSTDFRHVQNTEMWYVEHGSDGQRVITDHGEGICLHVDNNVTLADMGPAIYQKLSITAENSKMMFRARGFLSGGDKVGLLQVRVVDIENYTVTELKQNADDSSSWYEMDSNGYIQYKYDLSAYKGKDVVVIIGAKQGNHNAIERIRFIGEEEDWVMPFVTAADLENLTPYTAADIVGVSAIQNAFNDSSWNKVGDQGGANEGWLFKDADYAEEGSTQLRTFAYKKLTFTNVGSIVVRARTFSGQNSVSSGHDGQIYPEIIIRIIDENGNLVGVTSTYNRVDNGESCQDFYFKTSQTLNGNYTFVIGMARGQRMAVEAINFGAAMTGVNVTGTVKSAGVAVAGATVSYGYNRGSATTGADGSFTLPVDIPAGGSVDIVISKSGYADIVRTITGTGDAALGEVSFVATVLPNLTTEDIEGMTVLSDIAFGTDAIKDQWRQYGDVDKHGEGTCLQANASSPAYVCAKIEITAEKQFMKFNARMFVRDSDQRGLLQVKVIKADGSVDTLTPVRVYHGDEILTDRVLADGTLVNADDFYTEGVYDLSAYVGTTVVVAIIAVNDVEEVTKSIHNAINDIAFGVNSDTAFGKSAVS